MKKGHVVSSVIFLLLGVGLFTLVTWKWNVALAAWLAPVFLMRYFRQQRRWVAILPAVLLLWAASYANKAGAWGMELWMEVALLGIAALPMVIALIFDRFTAGRIDGFGSTLVFPAVYVAVDYAISFLPLGTVFSLSVSQFYQPPLLQLASLTGLWGIEFLILWAAPVINGLWQQGVNHRPGRTAFAVYAFCLSAALLFGGLRLVLARPVSPTVRVAGISVAHARNYWDVLIDQGTPEDQVRALAPEMKQLEDRLFAESEIAARGGAKVIFWSEADAFILPEEKGAFLQRAGDFSRQHQVYFMPAYQVLSYGATSGYNGLSMFTPSGELAYEYEKTMSWYATQSDGILHSVDTPYGRIGAAICFDMDFPGLIRQAARQNVDWMLVPAFDTYQTRVYHSEVGMIRGVEDGFSVVRMVNEGASMAIDYRGSLLASQDFFTTPSRIMMADLPTRGVATLYGALGDWFAWLSIVLAAAILLRAALRHTAAAPAIVEPA